MMTGNQIRAARGLLNWSGPALARASGVSLSTIRRAEDGAAPSNLAREAIRRAIEGAGVRFTENGGAEIGDARNYAAAFRSRGAACDMVETSLT